MKNLVIYCCLFVLSGCSVYKAASNEGVSVADIKACHYKNCLLSKGMSLIDSKEEKEANTITYTYRAPARKTGINYVRAAGHGVLDVMTLGLWEVAGTPIEGAVSNNNGYVIAKVTCMNTAPEEIATLEICDRHGHKVQ